MATDPRQSPPSLNLSPTAGSTKWRANGASLLGIIFLVMSLALLIYTGVWYVMDPPGPARADGGAYIITLFAALGMLSWGMVRLGYRSPHRGATGRAPRTYGVVGWLLMRSGILVALFHFVVLFGMTTVPTYEQAKLGRFQSVPTLEIFARVMPAIGAILLLVLPGWYFTRKTQQRVAADPRAAPDPART